jgi:hypothetical protein
LKVAPRKETSGYRNGRGCMVCELSDEGLQAVNAALWDGTDQRTKGYRARGQRAFMQHTGRSIEAKTITRHVEHTEDTWHDASEQNPALPTELPVFPTDYHGMVESVAKLGAKAAARLDQRIDADRVEDKDLISLVKIGTVARTQEEANRVADKTPQTQVALIFGIASGNLAGELPEYETIDVTPVEELRDEIRAERQQIAALAEGASEADEGADADELEALFD